MPVLSLHADDLILFAHIVDAGSISRASERTGLPKATLSRRLAVLEGALGERLMQRSTRRQALTEFGERMLEHARRLAEESAAAAALAQHRQASPQGTLRASFPPEFHELALVQVLGAFSRKYPEVHLELDLSSRRVDLLAERFDLAVRVATRLPDDSALVARRLVSLDNGLYASPAYLGRNGTPQTPGELLTHTGLVLVTSGGEPQEWRLSRDSTRWEGLPQRTLAANSLGLQQSLALQGLGIVGLSGRFTNELLAQGALRRVLPDWNLPPVTVWCVTPGRRLLPRQSLAFIEILEDILGADAH